jgi:hypothetical protein
MRVQHCPTCCHKLLFTVWLKILQPMIDHPNNYPFWGHFMSFLHHPKKNAYPVIHSIVGDC